MPRFTEDEVRNLRNTHLLRKFSDGDQTIIITTPKSLAEILTDTRFISYLKRFNFKEIIIESNDGIFSFSDTLKSRLGEQEEPSPSFKEPLPWTRAVNPDTKTFKSYISDIMRSRWYSNFGKYHQELETKLSEFLGVKEAVLVNNATIGLMLCIYFAKQNSKGNKPYVITTPFTFPATPHSAKFIGLDVAFCDIDQLTMCLSPEEVEKKIKKFGPPIAVIPVHVFGNVCDLEAFEFLKNKYGFYLIYDSAHAFGIKVGSQGIGAFGDFSVFSLHATKIFHTAEGGIITFNDSRKNEKIHFLRSFGIRGNDTCFDVGINAKLSEINCALGLAIWNKLDWILKRRKKLYEGYLKFLPEYLKPVKANQASVQWNYSYATFTVDKNFSRDHLVSELLKRNIIARKYFNPPLHSVSQYQTDVLKYEVNCSNADEVAMRTITLPLYPDLKLKDVRQISNFIKDIGFISA